MNIPPIGGYPQTPEDAAKRAKEYAAKKAKEEWENKLTKCFLVGVGLVGLYFWMWSKPKLNITPEMRARYNVPANPTPGIVWVDGYYRQDGTFVNGHYRTPPDHTKANNWSEYPNVNPYTGQKGSR